MLTRVQALGLATSATVWAVLPAAAQRSAANAWPRRPVRLICAGAPGSSPDVAARLYADRLMTQWGQATPVESHPGADGTLAVAHLLAQRDGHALLFSFIAALTVAPLLQDRLPFDPGDVAPISSGIEDFAVIVGTPKRSVASLGDLVELARRQPGALNWAAGAGDIYMSFLGFVRHRALDMHYIAYRAPAPALHDLAEGRIDTLMLPLVAALPQARVGRLRMLAIANPRRSPAAPDVPTAIEAGFPELSFEGRLGFFGPASMPGDLLEKIASDVRMIAANPGFGERLQSLGMVARADSPAEFSAHIEAERVRWAERARTYGSRPLR
jgi:tripartite-type tricarboxylate transporter receptor subunit TctC